MHCDTIQLLLLVQKFKLSIIKQSFYFEAIVEQIEKHHFSLDDILLVHCRENKCYIDLPARSRAG